MDKAAVKKIRDEILESALQNVRFDGWMWETLTASAAECGYEAAMAQAVFPGGLTGALDGFADYADRGMLASLDGLDPEGLKVRERIREALLARFRFLEDHKDAVRQSVTFWMAPWRKPRAAKIVWRTADVIWNWAGDDSKDHNYYTKRGLLSGIIVSTTLVWLNDETPDIAQTRDFLNRRIDDVMQIGKWMGKIRKVS